MKRHQAQEKARSSLLEGGVWEPDCRLPCAICKCRRLKVIAKKIETSLIRNSGPVTSRIPSKDQKPSSSCDYKQVRGQNVGPL